MCATAKFGQSDAIGLDQAGTGLVGFFQELAHARIAPRWLEINFDDGFGRGFQTHTNGVKAE